MRGARRTLHWKGRPLLSAESYSSICRGASLNSPTATICVVVIPATCRSGKSTRPTQTPRSSVPMWPATRALSEQMRKGPSRTEAGADRASDCGAWPASLILRSCFRDSLAPHRARRSQHVFAAYGAAGKAAASGRSRRDAPGAAVAPGARRRLDRGDVATLGSVISAALGLADAARRRGRGARAEG